MKIRWTKGMRGAWSALLLLAGITGVSKGYAEMDIQDFTLQNGMKVLVVHDGRAPVVTHSVWYNVGSMDEKPGKTGLAHMTEHLMFKGTKTYPAGVMDKMVQRKGGVLNAFTSYDFTAYYEKVPVTELEPMMDIESDRMSNLQLSDAVFQPERNVVAEERKLRTDSDPTDRFFEQVMRRHFPHHTYGHPVIGWGADIQGYTFEDAMDWYKTHYAPNNATLILVGNVTADQVKPLAEKYYGKLPAEDVPERVIPVEPLRTAPLEYIKIDPQVQVVGWTVMYRTPSQFQGVAGAPVVAGEATGLWVLSEILGGGSTSRLYQELVVKQQLADGASAQYDVVRAGESTFDISVQPKETVTADTVTDAVQTLIDDLLANGVTEEELQRAKVSIKADEIYARDDPFTSLYRLGMWVTVAGAVADFNTWQKELDALTVADVNALARKYFKPEGRTLSVLAGNTQQLGKLKVTKDQ